MHGLLDYVRRELFNMKIKVYNKKWEIKFIDGLVDEDGTMIYGKWDSTRRLIEIDKSVNKDEMRLTVIHELAHVIHCSTGFIYEKSIDMESLADFMSQHFDEISSILKKLELV